MKLSDRFENAMVYAAWLHRGQVRKGTEIPYISHLMSVAGIALDYGADEDEAIAALLHDAIEDQGGDQTRQEIDRRFGPEVVKIVNGCTDAEVQPKPPWRERKEAYIEHLKHAPRAVRLVSAADKVHNARSILKDYRETGEALWGRFNGGKEGTLWYYRSLVSVFRSAPVVPLVDELDRIVTEIEDLSS